MIRRHVNRPHYRGAMLLGLMIRDFVLIEKLTLAFRDGLCVLTGETGAGKSILLDALGLALGARSESGLVRGGAAQAVITAEFEPPEHHPVWPLLSEHGFATDPAGRSLVLRRMIGADGRSRAFVDDAPASVGLLKQIGELLVEIHGQFAQRGLLDAATHRELLDAFGDYAAKPRAVGEAWRAWREIAAERARAAELMAQARADEDYLRHALAELDSIAPQPGEEAALAERRAMLMHREKFIAAINSAIGEVSGERGAERALYAALRVIERASEQIGFRLESARAALERAAAETAEAAAQLEIALRQDEAEGDDLDAIEERLFALRALARKHNVTVDALADLRRTIGEKIATIEDGGDNLERLSRRETEAGHVYRAAAAALSDARRAAMTRLDQAVNAEMEPLRLGKARFRTVLAPLSETEWNQYGQDRIAFEISTNPGAPPGPLAQIASGGELSRLMLALRVVLARGSPAPTLVFDEVDSGIGGATAAAVGERLLRLGTLFQVLVITHSPQVAALGSAHWRVSKETGHDSAITLVEELDETERREEIARMLSGSVITAEARAAADSLMAGIR